MPLQTQARQAFAREIRAPANCLRLINFFARILPPAGAEEDAMTIKVKIPERRPSPSRLRAHVRPAAAQRSDQPAARSAATPTPVKRPLPVLPPLSAGQALRAALLVGLCIGFAQLTRVDRAHAERTSVIALADSTK
jgi:hypothetical protein